MSEKTKDFVAGPVPCPNCQPDNPDGWTAWRDQDQKTGKVFVKCGACGYDSRKDTKNGDPK